MHLEHAFLKNNFTSKFNKLGIIIENFYIELKNLNVLEWNYF